MFVLKQLGLLKKYKYITIRERSKWTQKDTKTFFEIFGLTPKKGRQYKKEHKIRAISEEHLFDLAKICDRTGISRSEFLKYPNLFKDQPLTLEQRYLQLVEGGFHVSCNTLANYKKCIQKNIVFLKLSNFIPKEANVCESFMSYLNPKPDRSIIENLTEEDTFAHIHHTILTRYLMWRCNTTQDDIERLYRVYDLNKVKSFRWLSQNLMTIEEVGLDLQRIVKFGFVLYSYPQSIDMILNVLKFVTREELIKTFHTYPKLLNIPLKNYKEVYENLKKAGISDDTIKKHLDIFLVSPTTLKRRLDDVKSIPELNLTIDNPLLLRLILRYNETRSRLSFLQMIGFRCSGLRLLGSRKDQLDSHLSRAKDMNGRIDTISYVRHLLKIDDDHAIAKKLRKNQYFRQVPLTEIKKSFNYLRKLKFSKDVMLEVLQIILYPKNKIEEAYKKIERLDRKSVTQIQKLNLLLYFLEKDHHFTGNGIWDDDTEDR